MQRICILGGSGFIGRHLVAALTGHGIATRVLTRRRYRARHLLVFPDCELIQTDVHYTSNINMYLADCDAAINLIGVLNEENGHGEGFEAVHAELPGKLTEACLFNRVRRIVHISALNAEENAPSNYLRTKATGERAAHAAAKSGIHVTSFRPSVVFGPGDSFFNRFAKLLTISPFIFPLVGANTRFAPVYVNNVVDAILAVLNDSSTYGKCYSLCGPRIYTLRKLVQMTADYIGRQRWIIPLPNLLAELQARLFERLPGKPLSIDNLRSMECDSVCEDNGLPQLGITPLNLEHIVPRYLRGGRSEIYSRLRTVRSDR